MAKHVHERRRRTPRVSSARAGAEKAANEEARDAISLQKSLTLRDQTRIARERPDGAHTHGAVIAPGSLVVDGNLKKVQHPTGGVVASLDVSEGQYVSAGDLLLRLDETQTRANYDAITNIINALWVRQTRLTAERDGRDAMELRRARAVPNVLPFSCLRTPPPAKARGYRTASQRTTHFTGQACLSRAGGHERHNSEDM